MCRFTWSFLIVLGLTLSGSGLGYSQPIGREKTTFMKIVIDPCGAAIKDAEIEAELRASLKVGCDLRKIGELVRSDLPKILAFGDWDYFYVTGDIAWEPNPKDHYKRVVVPRGFVTDLASVPRAFWSVFPPSGRYAYAAIIHDYLYWTQERPRKEADAIFRIAMEDSKVERTTVLVLFNSVRAVGKIYWDANAKRRMKEKRLLKEFPSDPLISWAEWQKRPGVFLEK